MPGQKFEADQIAERIGESKNFASGRPSTCLWPGFESPFCTLTVPVDLDDCAIDHGIFHVGIVRNCVKYPFENIGFDPVAESLEHRIPAAELPRKVPPGRARPGNPQNGIVTFTEFTAYYWPPSRGRF